MTTRRKRCHFDLVCDVVNASVLCGASVHHVMSQPFFSSLLVKSEITRLNSPSGALIRSRKVLYFCSINVYRTPAGSLQIEVFARVWRFWANSRLRQRSSIVTICGLEFLLPCRDIFLEKFICKLYFLLKWYIFKNSGTSLFNVRKICHVALCRLILCIILTSRNFITLHLVCRWSRTDFKR